MLRGNTHRHFEIESSGMRTTKCSAKLNLLFSLVLVWKDDGFLLTPRTLSSFEEQLPAELFVRVHKSFILNKKYVIYLE